MTKTFANLFFILITSTLIASCGFHLNSIKTLPPQLHQVYYQTEHPYEKFELAFNLIHDFDWLLDTFNLAAKEPVLKKAVGQ